MPPQSPSGRTPTRPRPKPKPKPPVRNPGSYTQSAPAAKRKQKKRVRQYNAAQKVLRENRQYGPTSAGAQKRSRRRRRRSEMPGAELRTPEAREYAAYLNEISGGLGRDVLRGALGTGRFAVDTADFLTGIPTFARDPSLENAAWVAASVLPVGRVAKGAASGARFATAAGRELAAPTRIIRGSGDLAVPIAPARSRVGRAVERGYDAARTQKGRDKRAAAELARTAKNRQALKGAPTRRLERIGRRFNAAEQTALRLVAEGQDLGKQAAYHAKQAEQAADRTSQLYHRIHADLIKQASKYLDNTPAGPVLKPGAPKQLREAWELLRKGTAQRESIYKALGGLTDEKILARLNAPGRVVAGAKWSDEAGALAGPAHETGKAYIPEVMGTPGLAGINPRTLARSAEAVVRRPPKRGAIGLAVRDPSLNHAYKGVLRETGFFRSDVTNVTAKSVSRALKADSIRWYRDQLLKAASDTYQPGWVAIKLDPTKNASAALKSFLAKIDSGGLNERDVQRLFGSNDEELTGSLLDELFPKHADVGDPNIRWVPPELIDRSAFHNPFSGLVLQSGPLGRAAGAAADAYNDLMRASILYLNPAYGVVNLLGNTAMNLIQQGIFYPRNVLRAWEWARKLSPENAESVRALMGTGLTHSLDLRTIGIKDVLNKVGSFISIMSDNGPRWTAFVHEAHRAGIKSAKDMDYILTAAREGNENAFGVIDIIARRGKDAIIDYDRLSPLERNIVARVLFFYPWVKGATRYTYRFPLEHPVQAAALAGGGYAAKQYADDELGPRPWYAQLEVPIPGMADDQGNPYVFNPRQLLPFTTPLEYGQAAAGWALGKNSDESPQIVGDLTPLLSSMIASLTGVDDRGYPVPKGPRGFLEAAKDAFPPKRLYEGLTTPVEEKRDRINPRTTRDEWLRLGFGGLAPKPYNKKEGAERADTRAKPPELPSYQKKYQWAMKQPEGVVSRKAKAHVRVWRRGQNMLNDGRRALAKQLGLLNQDGTPSVSRLTPRQEYAIKLAVIKKIRPGVIPAGAQRNFKRAWESGDEKVIDALKREINSLLSFSDVYGKSLETLLDEAME